MVELLVILGVTGVLIGVVWLKGRSNPLLALDPARYVVGDDGEFVTRA